MAAISQSLLSGGLLGLSSVLLFLSKTVKRKQETFLAHSMVRTTQMLMILLGSFRLVAANGLSVHAEELQRVGCDCDRPLGVFYGSSDHSILASDYAGQTYILGNNFEKVDSMATHSGYSTKDGSIVQLTIENSGLSAGDACLIFKSMMAFSVFRMDLVLSSNIFWAKT